VCCPLTLLWEPCQGLTAQLLVNNWVNNWRTEAARSHSHINSHNAIANYKWQGLLHVAHMGMCVKAKLNAAGTPQRHIELVFLTRFVF